MQQYRLKASVDRTPAPAVRKSLNDFIKRSSPRSQKVKRRHIARDDAKILAASPHISYAKKLQSESNQFEPVHPIQL